MREGNGIRKISLDILKKTNVVFINEYEPSLCRGLLNVINVCTCFGICSMCSKNAKKPSPLPCHRLPFRTPKPMEALAVQPVLFLHDPVRTCYLTSR